MKTTSFYLSLTTALFLFCITDAKAITSPYVTQTTNVPLDQSTTDSVNGVIPFFHSHTPLESGNVSTLVDATAFDTPGGNVILGPDNTIIGVAWDFGEPPAGFIWKLDRFDAWIAAGDNLRKGYQADLSISRSGLIDEFTVIPNTRHWDGLSRNDQYNHIRYDFPAEFMMGSSTNMDRYPVRDFRYLRLNSFGDPIAGTDWQTRFAETDIWVSLIPAPEELPLTFSSVTHAENGNITLSWNTLPSRSYVVEYKTDLNEANWTSLTKIFAGTETITYVNTVPADTQRFYRLTLQSW